MPAEETKSGPFAETMDVTTFLVIGQHYWGQGFTEAEAKQAWKGQGGRRLGDGYTSIEFPPGVEFHHVDNVFGTVYWNYADQEAADRPEPVATEHAPRGK